jgi:quercetin dioxygenase-like cupin family protein/SAM-dependent methyltransferase
MTTDTLTKPYRIAAGDGLSDVWWKTGRLSVKASGAETGNSFAQIEVDDPQGGATPLHVHHGEDETLHVLEGEVAVFVGGERIDLSTGDFGFAPRGIEHAYLVRSERARMLVTLSQAGLEELFVACGVPVTGDDPPADSVFPPPDELGRLFGRVRRGDHRAAADARRPLASFVSGGRRRRRPPERGRLAARRSAGLLTLACVAGRTQEALYAEIDLELSWSEDELPQVERTKHVHSLHPYLGKFIPQLVEVFLHRYFDRGDCVYDPFAGSGTALVEANVFGAASVGCDISAFNCLLARVKTATYSVDELERDLGMALQEAQGRPPADGEASSWLRAWYSARSLHELEAYRAAIARLAEPSREVGRVILSRAARSARLTTHFDLDFPRAPQHEAYWCHKHRRTCRPVDEALKFLRRYTLDTVRRLRAFSVLRSSAEVLVLHGDARTVELPREPSGIITSPPYPGLIDYHEQHAYAYELLGLPRRDSEEIGRGVKGYCDDIAAVLSQARRALRRGGKIVVVVNDRRGLYDGILAAAGLRLEERLLRHVNRRTGRRKGEYYEEVLIATP